MKSQQPTKFQKSTEILSNATVNQWCYVNTDNEFEFMNTTFQIDEKVDQYKVHNKAQYINGKLNNFTNEAKMDKILIVINNDGKLNFYDQDFEQINNEFIHKKG